MAFEPFTLPNGTILKNRIVKAAMEEMMADVEKHCQPSRSMLRLYETWGKGGSGLILSGHVMVDPLAMASPGDTLLAADSGSRDDGLWREWINSTQKHGAQFWFQINHPGRQMKKQEGLPAYGPSEIQVNLGRLSNFFGLPIAMSEAKIQEVIQQFVWTAKKAEELGVAGVEIHAAHGYLISQFLSPLSNIRTDRWGGSRENRSRLLFEVIRAVRGAVTPSFGVGVKINSSDFQRGGFEPSDLLWIVGQLNNMKLDFIELSGGNYESGGPQQMDEQEKLASTALREAFFIEVAKNLVIVAKMPIIVTGGIRKKATVDAVLATSDRLLAGCGTALGLVPDLPDRWRRGEDPVPSTSKSWVLPKNLRGIADIAVVRWNMRSIGKGSRTWHGVWPALALIVDVLTEEKQKYEYQKWAHGLKKIRKSM